MTNIAPHANPGTLYIVSTPIGNLEDITLRALSVLRAADVIACEDTRHTGRLLAHFGIGAAKTSLHDHNEREKTPEVLQRLREGKSVALVSDAGTPLISDPGWRLVRAALEEGLGVEWIPGAVAAIGALVLSGLPMERFRFEGFLPVKSGERRRRLEALRGERCSVVFYESPHRVLKTLADIEAVLEDARVSCSRELTKQFEETVRGTAAEVRAHFEGKSPRGEFVLVVQPNPEGK